MFVSYGGLSEQNLRGLIFYYQSGSEGCCSPQGVWGWDHSAKFADYDSYDKTLTESSVEEAFFANISGGVQLYDTAETYGSGLSEKLVGKFARKFRKANKASPEPSAGRVLIATKFQPGKWKKHSVRSAMMKAAQDSCKRLGVEQIDLYQIHAPLHRDPLSEQAEGLADLVDAGLVRAVGVSNFSLEQMLEIHAALATRGVPLASNQVEFSILRQLPLQNGMLTECKRLGVQLLAYSPLAMGRLTGKYSSQNAPQGARGFSNYPMEEIEPLLELLGKLAQQYEKTISQVALNWVIANGALPIPGSKNAAQASDNTGALGWALREEDVAQLTSLGKSGGTSHWQQG